MTFDANYVPPNAVACPVCKALPGDHCEDLFGQFSPTGRRVHLTRVALAEQTDPKDAPPLHQPRERPVPCRHCRKDTWHYDATCDACRNVIKKHSHGDEIRCPIHDVAGSGHGSILRQCLRDNGHDGSHNMGPWERI